MDPSIKEIYFWGRRRIISTIPPGC